MWTESNRAPNAAGTGDLATEIPLNNPFIPQEILDQAIADGATGIDFERRWTEFGRRQRGGDKDTTRIWGELDGEINDNWSWTAFYGYHESARRKLVSVKLQLPCFVSRQMLRRIRITLVNFAVSTSTLGLADVFRSMFSGSGP